MLPVYFRQQNFALILQKPAKNFDLKDILLENSARNQNSTVTYYQKLGIFAIDNAAYQYAVQRNFLEYMTLKMIKLSI